MFGMYIYYTPSGINICNVLSLINEQCNLVGYGSWLSDSNVALQYVRSHVTI